MSQFHLCIRTFNIIFSKIFMGKSLALTLQSVSLKLLEMFGINCYVVRSTPENLTGSDHLSKFHN